jgi:hypothetical protein
MIHATEKYNRIQDPAGIIPENEPVFLLRAQDIHAVIAVSAWLKSYREDPGHDEERAKEAMLHIYKMENWKVKKTPS